MFPEDLFGCLVLAALSTRLDLAGVTSFVRVLRLSPSAYRRLLHLFHSSALSLDRLTALWVQLVLRVFSPYTVGPYLVCLADGVKAPKEGRKMPAVKSLHQSADSNSKPPFIMGHSFQAISLLVRSASGHIAAVPLAARIHEGLVWSNRDQRTLLDRLVALFLEDDPDGRLSAAAHGHPGSSAGSAHHAVDQLPAVPTLRSVRHGGHDVVRLPRRGLRRRIGDRQVVPDARRRRGVAALHRRHGSRGLHDAARRP